MSRCPRAAALLAASLALARPAWAQQFVNFLEASPFADGENWFLTRALIYELPGTGLRVEVPAGFVSDFASIPRPFWSVLPTWGKYGSPAVVHDYLYWDQRCTREQADWILLLAMEETHVGPIQRFVIHRAVRWGGALAWRHNRRLRAAGWSREMSAGQRPAHPDTPWDRHQKTLFEGGVRPEPRPAPGPPPDYCERAEALWRAFQARH
jgi:hypothetical protein